MKEVKVALGKNSYQVHIGRGVLQTAADQLKETGKISRAVIITHPLLTGLYGKQLQQNLTAGGIKTTLLEVLEGEAHKSLSEAARLYDELNNLTVSRDVSIIALGGGVIGDLAGFVAATYLRGLPLVQIPTTLLSQVDSSIGGKVAVDYGELKNRIGAFYQPKLVIADINTLKSLPPRQVRSALGEVIKYAMIYDSDFFQFLEDNIERIKALNPEILETIVFRSACMKAAVVAQDELDNGHRNILNFGHTVGHAVEAVSSYAINHGEAVSIGMVAACRIAESMGIFSRAELERLQNLLINTGLPVEIPTLEQAKLWNALKQDKKNRDGNIRFILPRSIGEVYITDEIDKSLVEEILNSHEANQNLYIHN